ncbi:alpha/beta hydrolase [Paraburkholderia sediminicola]|uniref:alpha/beta hydrolase n=1 Tax=Paraburkholderia sediminicola TaxID=458836 RepID=UPI0038BA07DC
MPLYRQFSTQDELDNEYDPERRVTTPEGLTALRAQRALVNQDVLALPERIASQHYGPTRVETVDIYPAAEPNAPILFYMHGGYWSAPVFKESLGWVSIAPRQRGVTTIVVDYGQCPLVTLDEVVRQCRAALAWTYKNASVFGGDRERIYVTGNSAGGHLTAMLALTDWEGLYGLPQDIIKGGCPFSGLYDLMPLRFTWLQPKLQLDGDQIYRNSPMNHIRAGAPPLLVLWGGDESKEFWRQSEEFHKAYSVAGNTAELMPIANRDHYSVLSAWRQPDSNQFNMIMDHMKSCVD